MKRIFSIMLSTLLLLTACTTTAEDSTTTTATTPAVTAPSNPEAPKTIAYRPDLAWSIDLGWGNDGYDVFNPIIKSRGTTLLQYNGATLSEIPDETRYPYVVYLSITIPAENGENDTAYLQPTEYLKSLGWEILPQTASEYVENRKEYATLAVATKEQTEALEVSELLEYYGIEFEPDRYILHLYHAIQLPEGIDDPNWNLSFKVVN